MKYSFGLFFPRLRSGRLFSPLASHSKTKTSAAGYAAEAFLLVPMAGVEPARYRYQRILSPSRLPIPSHRQISFSIIAEALRKIKSNLCSPEKFFSVPRPTANLMLKIR